MIYDRLGRFAISFALAYLRRRYRREIRLGLGFGAAGLAVAAYLAARHAPEG